MRELGCDLFLVHSPPACIQTVAGTVPVDGDCQRDEDCAGSAFCKVADACPGRCAPRGQHGAPCAEDDHCRDETKCLKLAKTCGVPPGLGQPCGGGVAEECAMGLLCLGANEDEGQAGTCRDTGDVLTAREGQPCSFDAGPWCEVGQHCVLTGFSQEGAMQTECRGPAAAGADCHPALPDMCPAGQSCHTPPDSIDGTCTPYVAAGEACQEGGLASGCQPYHRCQGGVCRALQGDGGECTTDAGCYSELCRDGTCAGSVTCD